MEKSESSLKHFPYMLQPKGLLSYSVSGIMAGAVRGGGQIRSGPAHQLLVLFITIYVWLLKLYWCDNAKYTVHTATFYMCSAIVLRAPCLEWNQLYSLERPGKEFLPK